MVRRHGPRHGPRFGPRSSDKTMRRRVTRNGAAPTVVKLGGSCASSLDLRRWTAAVVGCAGEVVVVPGGGSFADAVRAAQPAIGFDDAAAHHMALLAMEQFGRALASLDSRLSLADSTAALRRRLRENQVAVWLPI